MLGDPVNALVWLANRLPDQGRELKAGDVVTTGTAAGVAWCEAGDTAVAEFGPWGQGGGDPLPERAARRRLFPTAGAVTNC